MKALPGPLSEVAPGVWVSGVPDFETPSHVLCKLVPGNIPGTYILEPEPFPGWVRMGRDIGARIGVIGLNSTAVYRLMWGGFLDHVRLHPSGIFISLESLLSHFRATRNDCEKGKSFWTPERRDIWKQTHEVMEKNSLEE